MGAAVSVPLIVVGAVIGSLAALGSECEDQTPQVATDSVPSGPVAGFDRDQLLVAASIINDGASRAVPMKATTFALAASIADSRLEEPPAESFFGQLLAIDNWDTIDPAQAINAVQGSPDPLAYADALPAAGSLMAALANQDQPCGPGAPGEVSADGWARPAAGPVTSEFGRRVHPVTGEVRTHYGIDIAPDCGAPIYAATSGRVTHAGVLGTYGYLIAVDHGGGVETRYAHMFADGLFVRVGDEVSAGQHIAEVGSTGYSTGCHLHFEIRVDGSAVDPRPVLAAVGALESQ